MEMEKGELKRENEGGIAMREIVEEWVR